MPEPFPQRRLALELRYAIDIARKQPSVTNAAKVAELIDSHPHGFLSSHVQHNLGQARVVWLYENGLLPKGDRHALYVTPNRDGTFNVYDPARDAR